MIAVTFRLSSKVDTLLRDSGLLRVAAVLTLLQSVVWPGVAVANGVPSYEAEGYIQINYETDYLGLGEFTNSLTIGGNDYTGYGYTEIEHGNDPTALAQANVSGSVLSEQASVTTNAALLYYMYVDGKSGSVPLLAQGILQASSHSSGEDVTGGGAIADFQMYYIGVNLSTGLPTRVTLAEIEVTAGDGLAVTSQIPLNIAVPANTVIVVEINARAYSAIIGGGAVAEVDPIFSINPKFRRRE
jgi:hypothetical protein